MEGKEQSVGLLVESLPWEGESEWQPHFGSWVGTICKARVSQKSLLHLCISPLR